MIQQQTKNGRPPSPILANLILLCGTVCLVAWEGRRRVRMPGGVTSGSGVAVLCSLVVLFVVWEGLTGGSLETHG